VAVPARSMVNVFSPENKTYYTNSLLLNLSVIEDHLGNSVRCSLDGGELQDVAHFKIVAEKPVEEEWFGHQYNSTQYTIMCDQVFNNLSFGDHSLIVYNGYVDFRWHFYSNSEATVLFIVQNSASQPFIFSSGLAITSPANKTYTSNVVECSGSFDCPKGYQSSLNYSTDGIDKGALPWKLDANSIANLDIYTIDGSFELPQLPDGSHQLSIGILEQLYDNSNVNSPRLINSSSWINTVYFTIGTQSTPTATSSPSPTPTVPEFPAWAFLPLLFFAVSATLLLKLRKHKCSSRRE